MDYLPSPTPSHPARLHRSSQTRLKPSSSNTKLSIPQETVRHTSSSNSLSSQNRLGLSAPLATPSKTSSGLVQKLVKDAEGRSTPSPAIPQRPSSQSYRITPAPINAVQPSAPRATDPAPGSMLPQGKRSRETLSDVARPRSRLEPGYSDQSRSVASASHSSAPAPLVQADQKQGRFRSFLPSEDPIEDDWETEVIRSAKDLRISRTIAQHSSTGATGKTGQSGWEREGLWNTKRDPAREAEDRIRRETGREIGECNTSLIVIDQSFFCRPDCHSVCLVS